MTFLGSTFQLQLAQLASCKTDFLFTLSGALSYKQVSAANRVWLSGSEVLNRVSVIFLQIVVLIHETLLVKNHESQSRTVVSQFKKQ